MKKIVIILSIVFCFSCKNKSNKTQIAEVSCGQCQFDLTSTMGCDLAVRIDDKAYFVDGAHIDDFGDAHALETGFCTTIRKAEVVGELIDNRYKISSIKLLDK